MRRLSVGVVVPGWSGPNGDAALPALQDLLWAAAHDHDLRIVAVRHPAVREPYRDAAGIPVTPLGLGVRGGPLGRAAVIAAGVTALRRLHRTSPFDVLHGFWADEPGMVATLAGRALGRRVIVSVMGGELVELPEIGYGALLGRGGRIATGTALRGAHLVTTGSAALDRAVAAVAPAVPLRMLPLGVDLGRFAPGTAGIVAEVPPRLVFAGSLTPVKDPVLLLRSFARVDVPGVTLEIVGDGPMRGDLERLAAVLGVADRVRFQGAVPRERMADILRGAAALVVTSHHEAQSMVAVEAAACGVPVAGTPVGVVPELVRAGAAAVAAGRRPSAVAAAIADVLDQSRWSLRATAARMHAAQAWDERLAVQRLVRAWHELIAIPDGG